MTEQSKRPSEPFDEPRSEVEPGAAYRGENEAGGDEPLFAPPPKWVTARYSFTNLPQQDGTYHPKEATWAEEERQQLMAEPVQAYRVENEKKERRPLRVVLITVLVLCIAAGGGAAVWWFTRPPQEVQESAEATAAAVASVTPPPVQAYEVRSPAKAEDAAMQAVWEITEPIDGETALVTDEHIVLRQRRADELFDFYVFEAATGRLQCYLESLGKYDVLPAEGGALWVPQRPYLIGPDGGALIPLEPTEAILGETLSLRPISHGWALVRGEHDANFLNTKGELISPLWFCRTFSFTGSYTLGYADTGNTAEGAKRYLLYVLGEDGSSVRWLASGDTGDVLGCVSGMAYLKGGDLYALPDTASPVLNTTRVDAYPDCDAMVVRHPSTGKYALLVHGKVQYDFGYDAIYPMQSDLVWQETEAAEGQCRLVTHTVCPYGETMPAGYTFVLEKDGETAYASLSAVSAYPVLPDGKTETEGTK